MKAIVCGAGQQGTPIAYALLKLGLEVLVVEPFQGTSKKSKEKLKKLIPEAFKEHRCLFYNDLEAVNSDDIEFLISAAPYHQNVKIADWALSKGIPYCDLGGDPDTRYQIFEKANEYQKWTMTDLGLAPGLVNIVAEHMMYNLKDQGVDVTDVFMRVGGLPIDPTGFLNYKRTWSTHGLRNEYSGPCQCVKHKVLTSELALTEVERVDCFPELGILECFHTKGGLAHSYADLPKEGIVNCNYKTLRWPGHADALRFLLEQCQLSEEAFDNAIENACPATTEDQVLLMAQANSNLFTTIIKHDENWTAMQIATAFPAAAGIYTMATIDREADGPISYNKTYAEISKHAYAPFVDALCKIDEEKFADFKEVI